VASIILPVCHNPHENNKTWNRYSVDVDHSFVHRETKCVHHRALTHSSNPVADDLVTGTWNVFTIEGATHASIVPGWTGSELQIAFFEGLGERLYLMEERWAASRAA